MVSFSPPIAGRSKGRHSRTLAQATAEAYLLSNPNGEALIDTAAEIFDKHSSDIESDNGVQAREEFISNLRDEIRHLPDFAVFAVDAQESPYKRELYERVVFPILPERDRNRDDETRIRAPSGFNGNQAALWIHISSATRCPKRSLLESCSPGTCAGYCCRPESSA